jgi:ATP-dependent DNA helicase RecG
VEDIRRDLTSDKKMLRLLQGDVGSGKTVVGLLAMASAIEAGRQAAMMAPTEILARQHYERLAPMAEQAGLSMALLTGGRRAAERRATSKACPGRPDRHRGREPTPVPGIRRLSLRSRPCSH